MAEIGIVGLGYVGRPLAEAFAGAGHTVTGYDVDETKIAALRTKQRVSVPANGIDAGEIAFTRTFRERDRPEYSTDPASLRNCRTIITAVSTPVTESNRPDLSIVRSAAETIGSQLTPGTTVVLESTVYPGATRNEFVPALEDASGLSLGVDFDVGYSPERVNPGRSEDLRRAVKPVSANTDAVRAELTSLYGEVVDQLFPAPSIESAEAAKCLENTQRDLNIALINEFAMACDRIDGLDYEDVLSVAETKWNFDRYEPGLVEGHCIPVDPYYLIEHLESHGASASLMRTGRAVNESVVEHVVASTVDAFVERDRLADAERTVPDRVLVVGLAYKPNADDIRSGPKRRLFDGLRDASLDPVGYDPHVDPADAAAAFDIEVWRTLDDGEATGVLVLTDHDAFDDLTVDDLLKSVAERPVIVDVPRLFEEPDRTDIIYRRL